MESFTMNTSVPAEVEQVPRDENGRWLPGYSGNAAMRFKPGQSGNPAGRTSFGAHVSEWINSMADWSVPQLQGVIDDEDQPSAKVAAAQRVLSARQSGEQAAKDFDRCCDRTHGKPTIRTDGGDGPREIVKSYAVGPMDEV